MKVRHRDIFSHIAGFVLLPILLQVGCSSSSPVASTSTALAIPSDKLSGEEEVLPQFVVDAVLAAVPDGHLLAALREEESGEIIYEVLVQTAEGDFEVDVAADGTIIEIEPASTDERVISRSDLPAEVLAAVEATVPGGRISHAQRESVRGDVVYDVEVDVRGEKFDLEIAADGTVLKVEEGN